ncbi:MAG: DUF4189 domain-containing protein [Deltaproteobacteria bacterium]|nr:MAG: DUF4189 domain-containing protein [Deltaproteobacteria bacterium]
MLCSGLETSEAGSSRYGALAVDGQHKRYGFSYNQSSLSSAMERAKSECGRRCSVVLTFGTGMCGAYARGSGSSYGWGKAKSKSEAQSRAISECNSRGRGCYIRSWGCNR